MSASLPADDFPTIMQCGALMAMVQAGPSVLELQSIVQFPVHKRDAPSLTDFVEALQTSTTITSIRCNRHFTTGFNDEEWCQILRAFGSVERLESLVFVDGGDSRLRRLRIDVLVDVLTSARRLRHLQFGKFWLLMGNDAHRHALAVALQHHATLQSLAYAGCGIHTQLYQSIAPRANANAILDALSTCRQLESIHITNSPYCAYDYTTAGLLELGHATKLQSLALVTRPSNWNVVGSLLSQFLWLERLTLIHSGCNDAPTADAVMAMVRYASRPHTRLRHLALHVCGAHVTIRRTGLNQSDERQAVSQVLVELLRHNTAIQCVHLSDSSGHGYRDEALNDACRYRAPKLLDAAMTRAVHVECWNEEDYDNLVEAVRANGRTQVYIDMGVSETDTKLVAAYHRLTLESMLNAVGRYRTSHGKVNDTRDERQVCLESMAKLNDLTRCSEVDDSMIQSCWYELVRTYPLLCYRQE